MAKKIRWGVLGVANIAVRKVIPAMQDGTSSEIVAIASRDSGRARAAAQQLDIAKSYGSYEELLADDGVDAIFNPLPNELHVPWSIKCAHAGKHVLCEKPIGITAAEVISLIAARDAAGVKIGEAFMVRTHPQWIRARELVRSGRIGQLRAVSMLFTYFNRDSEDIVNRVPGGGALLDIGCYGVTLSRFAFGEEPVRVFGTMERDPEYQTDRLTSAILEFPSGQATFLCGTQLARCQHMQLLGTNGHIEFELPVSAPLEGPAEIYVDNCVEEIPACNQYTIQGDLFSRAILENTPVPVPLEDALKNMMVIDAIGRSAISGRWETVDVGDL